MGKELEQGVATSKGRAQDGEGASDADRDQCRAPPQPAGLATSKH